MEDERNWFVGVDWASETHHRPRARMPRAASSARGRSLTAAKVWRQMAAWLLATTGAAPEAVFVAIEVPHGPVVESLMERGFRVLRDQSQAARSLPRPLHAGRRQG